MKIPEEVRGHRVEGLAWKQRRFVIKLGHFTDVIIVLAMKKKIFIIEL
jgi:hypothetical protein